MLAIHRALHVVANLSMAHQLGLGVGVRLGIDSGFIHCLDALGERGTLGLERFERRLGIATGGWRLIVVIVG